MIKTSDKVFVVSLDKIEELDIQTPTLETMSIEELEKISCGVLEPKQAIKHLNFPEVSPYDVEDHLFIYREVESDDLNISMGKDDSFDVIVNKDLQVHINTNGGEGYNIDLYAYNEDTPEEERDFDNEFISSCYASYAELEEARNTEEE